MSTQPNVNQENRTFGAAYELPPKLDRDLRLQFHTGKFALRWTHCSSTATFISSYYASLFKVEYPAAQANDLTHSIAYLANELLENAVKFRTEGDVEVQTGLHGEEFVMRVTNHIGPETSATFQVLLSEITAGDPGELLLQRIEANAADENGSGSGLGILTLMSDYGVRFCWTFTPETPSDGRVLLQTIARLPLPQRHS
jgi:hypothetical protein